MPRIRYQDDSVPVIFPFIVTLALCGGAALLASIIKLSVRFRRQPASVDLISMRTNTLPPPRPSPAAPPRGARAGARSLARALCPAVAVGARVILTHRARGVRLTDPAAASCPLDLPPPRPDKAG